MRTGRATGKKKGGGSVWILRLVAQFSQLGDLAVTPFCIAGKERGA
jgi:hypothetical protein